MNGDSKKPLAFLGEIWANHWVKLFVLLVAFTAFAGFLYLIWPVLKLLVIALVLAYLFDPLADRLQKWRLPRTAAVALIFLCLILVIAGVAALLIPFLSESVGDFVVRVPGYAEKIRAWINPLIQKLVSYGMPATFEEWVSRIRMHTDILQDIAKKISAPALWTLKGTFSGLTGFIKALLNFIIVPVAWFYLLRDIDPLKAALLKVFPPRQRPTVLSYALEIDAVVANFMRGQLTVCLILGLLYAAGLQFVAGVPLGVVIGLFAGIASIVPYLGVILAIGPALVLAALEHGDIIHPVLVIAVFATVHAVTDNLITPKVLGGRLGLHPVTVIFAILIWGSLLGITGMLIAVPITAVFRVFGKKALERYKAGEFFSFGASKPDDR